MTAKRRLIATLLAICSVLLLHVKESNSWEPFIFVKHTITNDFDGARSVFATDVDGDGDVDVLGAASTADNITWWEQEEVGPSTTPYYRIYLPLIMRPRPTSTQH